MLTAFCVLSISAAHTISAIDDVQRIEGNPFPNALINIHPFLLFFVPFALALFAWRVWRADEITGFGVACIFLGVAILDAWMHVIILVGV